MSQPAAASRLKRPSENNPQSKLHRLGHGGASSLRFAGKLHENINRPEQLKQLLAWGMEDVNGIDPVNGDTALHRVLKKKNPNLQSLKLLLDADADVDLKNKRGETPLHCLMDHEAPSLAALDLLLASGAKVNKRDRTGYYAVA